MDKSQIDSSSKFGILLLAFGGPDSLDSVEPFLKSVIKGRPVTTEQIERVQEKYKTIGGKSPLLDITKSQAKALEKELNKNYKDIRVYLGMRHWPPLIKDTLDQMAKDGIKQVLTVIMAPQSSKASTGGYEKAINEALQEISSELEVNYVESWHNHPEFIQALSNNIKEGLSQFSEDDVCIIFSAHSLPKRTVEKDPYVEQLNETINNVVNLTGITNYCLAYQSRGGGPFEWLGPDVDSVLEEIAGKGIKNVILIPLSFVADHIETLYDIDVVYKKKANDLGLNFRRTDSFNDSPEFINTLSKIISEKLKMLLS